MNRENKIYLQILELIEKEYDAKQGKQNYIIEEEIGIYSGKNEITKEEIAKYFGNYKNIMK